MRTAALVFLAFFTVPAFATVIVQKNGDVISGRILEEKADKYVFQSPYGKLQIAKANVAKLILDEKTIELKNVTVGDKTVKARLVNQDKNTSVYLTEDGRTIRKDEKETKPEPKASEEPAKKESPRDKILIAVAGYYGYSTFSQFSNEQQPAGGQAPFEQKLHPGSFGFHLSGHYAWFPYMGVGANASFNRWSGTVNVDPPAPATFTATSANTSLFAAPSVVFSAFGNLGSTAKAHDLRLELQAGAAFNSATVDLAFKTAPGGFPASATASGRNVSLGLQAQLYYLYSISESFRVRLGVGYYRMFYTTIYEGGLQSTPTVPGTFKTEFDGNLNRGGVPPQIISAQLGFEIGF
jgi:hypothetical protein